MIIDKNGKLFGKISIIDIVIIILVICCGVAAYLRFSGHLGNNDSNRVNATYEITVQPVRAISVDAIKKSVGLKLYDRKTSAQDCIGTITNVEQTPYDDVIALADGTYKNAVSDTRYSVKITVNCECTLSDTTLSTPEGKLIELGQTEYIGSKWFASEGEITKVSFE